MNAVSIYREEVLDHYRNPRNFGKLPYYDTYSRQTNPLCGDDISMWIKLKHTDKSWGVNRNTPVGCTDCVVVGGISFQGKGCAICLSAASMLTEHVKGKSKHQLTKFSENDMLELLSIEVSETRKKCAMLSLAVLRDCLK